MVKIMENPIKMDDLGVPLFFGNIHMLGLEGVDERNGKEITVGSVFYWIGIEPRRL